MTMPDPFDRVLRDAARRGRSVGVCPDAAMLAAYVDDGLTPAERREFESHAAGCAACQEHLALLGAVSVESRAPEAARSWFPRWAWLVPAATAVIVAAVWIRVPEQSVTDQLAPRTSQPLPAPASIAEAPASANEEAKPGASPGPPRSLPAPVEAKRKRDEAVPEKAAAAAPPPPLGVAPAAPPPAFAQDAVREQEKVEARDLLAAESPAKEAEGGQRAAREMAPLAKSRDDSSALTAPMVVSASSRESFRALGNRIERSTDDGKTWQPAMTMPDGMFTAAACARGVCWFGTSDGRIERRVRGGFAGSILPVREPVVTIVPSDSASALVTLAGGRSFRTTDSGATWTAEP